MLRTYFREGDLFQLSQDVGFLVSGVLLVAQSNNPRPGAVRGELQIVEIFTLKMPLQRNLLVWSVFADRTSHRVRGEEEDKIVIVLMIIGCGCTGRVESN